jgi:hypothetical protein
MSPMKRNCLLAVVAWVVLLGVYGYLVRDIAEDGKYIGVFVMATVVWIGLIKIQGVRFTVRDWRAKRRMARGERPRDGELAAATGPVHPTLDVLRAPFSGSECVLYSYEIGLPGTGGEGRPPRDYLGFGMTRCSVRTPYGEVALGSFPVMEHFFETDVDREAAAQYVAETSFDQQEGFTGLIKAMFSVHTASPPLKIDWKLGDSEADVRHAMITEKIIAPGETITAIGRYVGATNAIVSDTQEKGFLRVTRGGDGLRVGGFPWSAVWASLGGILIIAAAHAMFFFLLQQSR